MSKINLLKIALPAVFALILLTPISLNIYRSIQQAAAAEKGVKWLIAQKDKMQPDLAITNYKKLYKVTSDKKTADKLFRIISDIQKSSIPPAPVNIDEKDSRFSDWKNIVPAATDLLNEQCMGIDNSQQVDRLKNVFLTKRGDIEASILKSQDLTDALISLYFLGKLKIYDQNLVSKATEITLENLSAGDYSFENIYALTHIILTNSGYYERYLNPADFQKESGLLEGMLSRHSSTKKVTSLEMDTLSEALISLKLLKMGDNKNTEIIRQKLVGLQNKDGSWGDAEEASENTVHHTMVATLALMNFTENLRSGEVFCWSK